MQRSKSITDIRWLTSRPKCADNSLVIRLSLMAKLWLTSRLSKSTSDRRNRSKNADSGTSSYRRRHFRRSTRTS